MTGRRWLGIGVVDVVIQAIVTICAAAAASGAVNGHDAVTVPAILGVSMAVFAVRRHFALARGGADENAFEGRESRLAELEERVDFAERMLSQRPEHALPLDRS